MENIKLIKYLSQSFHYTTKEDLDDLFQEAALAYLTALKDYNPSKGKLSTFMWWTINSSLKNYCKKNKQHFDPLISIENVKITNTYTMDPFMENLSVEAKEIVDIITKRPTTFVTMPKQECLTHLQSILSNLGWDSSKIYRGLQELKLACN